MDNRRSNRPNSRPSHQSESQSQNHSQSHSTSHSNQRSSHGDQQRSGSSHHNRSGSHHNRGRSHNGGRQGGGPIQELVTHASRRLSNHSAIGIFVLAFLGGGLVTLGTLFGVTLASQVTDPTLRTWLLSIGIATGLFILVGLNAVLFTEPNVIMPTNFYNRTVKKSFLGILQFWLFAWAGSFLGTVFFAWFIQYGHSSSAATITLMTDIVNNQLLNNASGSATSFWEAMFSGVLSNWVLGFALIYSVYNRAAVGKVFILLITVCLVVTTNLQFFPLNLSYFSLLKATSGTLPGWFALITSNLIPVSIGNLIGGSFLVALPLLFQTKQVRVKSS